MRASPDAITAGADYVPPDSIEALRLEEADLAARLIKEFPLSADAQYVMATVEDAEGRHAEAAKYWKRCLELDPRYAPAYERMGKAALDRGDLAQAETYYRKVIELDPTLPGAFDNLGSALLAQGKFAEAAEALVQELKNSPTSSQAYFHLGRAYLLRADYAKAKENYAHAVALRPNYKFAYYGLAQACDKLGLKDEAAAHRAKFAALEEDYRDGERNFRRAHNDLAAMRHDVAITHINAGEVYKTASNFAEAERHWKIAFVLDPKNTQPLLKLAALYERMNQPAQALAVYERLIALEPEKALHHFNTGNVYFVTRQFDAAEKAYRRVIELAPQRADGYRALVQLYLTAQKEPAAMLSVAKTAAELAPNAPNFFNLARAHRVNGERVECRAALERALALDPENALYKAFAERLNAEEAER